METLVSLFLFFPSRGGAPPPPPAQQVWFHAEDGVRLHAIHVEAGPDAPVVLWAHGNAGNISDRAVLLPAMRAAGLSVLAYDYRGYGLSDDVRPTVSGVLADGRAAYRWLMAQGVSPDRVVLFGESLGGAVSLALAREVTVAGVVVLSTFTSLRDVATVHYGPLGWLVGGSLDSRAAASGLQRPLLVLHGTEDELIPVAHGQELARRAPHGRFIGLPGGGHNDVLSRPEVLAHLRDFALRRP